MNTSKTIIFLLLTFFLTLLAGCIESDSNTIGKAFGGTLTEPQPSQPAANASPVHYECKNKQCIAVAGAGINRCAPNQPCSGNYEQVHFECRNNSCVQVNGAGSNSCLPSNGSCITCAEYSSCHMECRNNSCVQVEGIGQNQCSSNGACLLSLCGNGVCDENETDNTSGAFCPIDCRGIPIRITSNSFDEENPTISDSTVIFSSNQSGARELFRQNLNSSEPPIRITFSGSTPYPQNYYPSLSGQNLVWKQQNDSGNASIFYQSLFDGNSQLVQSPSPMIDGPHMGDHHAIWSAYGNRVWAYNLNTGNTTFYRLADGSVYQPRLDGAKVTLVKNYDINILDLDANTNTLGYHSQEYMQNADIWGTKLAFNYRDSSSYWHVAVYDMQTQTFTHIAQSAQLYGSSDLLNIPRIFGDKVTWIDQAGSGVKLYEYDLSRGIKQSASQILTVEPPSSGEVLVEGFEIGQNGIVWSDNSRIANPLCPDYPTFDECNAQPNCYYDFGSLSCKGRHQSDVYYYGFPICGNGVCEGSSTTGENNTTCPADCGAEISLDGIGQVQYSSNNYQLGIAVQGNYAYVPTFYSNSLSVIDISNPVQPTKVSEITNADPAISMMRRPTSVFVDGNYAFVTGSDGNSLSIINIQNPLSPQGAGQVTKSDPQISSMKYPKRVFVKQNYAYVVSTNGNSVAVIDVSNPYAPDGVATITNADPQINLMQGPTAVFVKDNMAYITAGGLFVVDVTNPSNPDGIGQVTHLDPQISGMLGPNDVVVQNNYAYVTSSSGGSNSALSIIDVSNPAAPDGISQITDEDSDINSLLFTYRLAVDGNYAYVIGGNMYDFLGVIKISNPQAPDGIAQFQPKLDPQTSLASNLRGIQLKEDKLYVTSFQGTLAAIIQINKNG